LKEVDFDDCSCHDLSTLKSEQVGFRDRSDRSYTIMGSFQLSKDINKMIAQIDGFSRCIEIGVVPTETADLRAVPGR